MDIMKNLLRRIGHFVLTIVNVLRRAVCCRRKKESDYVLPLTIDQVSDSAIQQSTNAFEFPSQWDSWPDNDSLSSTNLNVKNGNQVFHQEENPDDFFKDMVPQIRKPKKLYIRKDTEEREESINSNRLAMDPKAVLSGPDLGIIDDNPSNWEDNENSEGWDPNELIRETKKAEREKRLAEHQRRKQERESRRASKQDSSNSIAVLNLSDSRDKTKSS